MKRLAAGLMCAALALTFAGCPDKRDAEKPQAPEVPTGPEERAEQEPNDRAEQALVLTRSSHVVGALAADSAAKGGDEDWYALEAPATGPKVVDLSVSGIQGVDLVVGLFDADENPLLTLNAKGEGEGERFPNLGLTRRVLVRVGAAKKGQGGAYTVTALFNEQQPGFEAEPNDRAVDATPLQFESPVQGFLAHGGDVDFFRIELPGEEPPPPAIPETEQPQGQQVPPVAPPPTQERAAETPTPTTPLDGEPTSVPAEPTTPADAEPAPAPTPEPAAAPPPPEFPEPEPMAGALRVELTAVPGVRLEVSVLTEAEAPLFETKAGAPDEGLTLRNVGYRRADRVLYVVVKSAWTGSGKEAKRGFNAEAPYTLSVSQEAAAANAEFEPNDEPGRATPLPRDGYREGFLSPKTDEDLYVLRTDGPVLAQFQLSGVERVDLALEVVRPKDGGGLETLLRANDGAVKEGEILNNVACNGECFVKVEGAARRVDGKWGRDSENAEQPYRLSVSVTADNGVEEREPNNTAETATRIGLGHPIRGTIQPRKDTDLYLLDLSGRMVRTPLRATLIGILKVDLGLYLHRLEEDGTLSLVQTADRAKGEQPEVIRFSAEPGRYVFEVRDSSKKNDANFQDRYQLSVIEE